MASSSSTFVGQLTRHPRIQGLIPTIREKVMKDFHTNTGTFHTVSHKPLKHN
jgi:hypothetical protein